MRTTHAACPRPQSSRVGRLFRCALAWIAGGVLFAACQRESAPPPPTETTPPPGTGTQTPAPNEAEIVATHRLLDYLENLLQRKEFEQARRAIAELESRPMTPAQRQKLQQLKGQLPPG